MTSDDVRNAGFFRRNLAAYDASQAVDIRDGNGATTKFRRPCDDFFGMAAAAQEGKIRRDLQFGVGDRSGRRLRESHVSFDLRIWLLGHKSPTPTGRE